MRNGGAAVRGRRGPTAALGWYLLAMGAAVVLTAWSDAALFRVLVFATVTLPMAAVAAGWVVGGRVLGHGGAPVGACLAALGYLAGAVLITVGDRGVIGALLWPIHVAIELGALGIR